MLRTCIVRLIVTVFVFGTIFFSGNTIFANSIVYDNTITSTGIVYFNSSVEYGDEINILMAVIVIGVITQNIMRLKIQ